MWLTKPFRGCSPPEFDTWLFRRAEKGTLDSPSRTARYVTRRSLLSRRRDTQAFRQKKQYCQRRCVGNSLYNLKLLKIETAVNNSWIGIDNEIKSRFIWN